MKNKIRLTVIGCGNMARAIIDGLTSPASKAVLKANGDVFDITVTDLHEKKLVPMREKCRVSIDNAAAVKDSDYVLIAVKPQQFESAVCNLSLAGKVVISIMAGVTLEKLRTVTGAGKLVRVMPNLNARVSESMSAYCSVGLSGEEERVVLEILGSFGRFMRIDESKMDAFTGIAGSGPAFIFMAIKAFYDEAISRGFSPELAKELTVQTFVGSALTAERHDGDFDSLVDSVCSPGGTTIEGVNYLNDNRYIDTIRAAIDRAVKRSEEMSK